MRYKYMVNDVLEQFTYTGGVINQTENEMMQFSCHSVFSLQGITTLN